MQYGARDTARVNLEELLSNARLRELLTAYSITQPVTPFTEGQVVLLLKGTGCHASPYIK